MSSLAYWVHDLSPFLIRFTDTLGIRYYGLAYVLGFVGGGRLLHRAARAQRLQLPPAAVGDLMIALVLGVLVGGRLGYFLLYHPELVVADPLVLLRVWEGGMASHGGFVGVALAMAWFVRRQRIPLLHLSDAVVAVAPLGILLGRIANFINGELWGRVTTFKYAVIFPDSAPPGTPIEFIEPRHASQLYAAALEGALLLAVFLWRFWRTPVVARSPGRLTGEFLVAYAVVRSIGEQFREPDAPLIGGLTRGTFYSIFLVLVGVFLIIRSRTRSQPAGQ